MKKRQIEKQILKRHQGRRHNIPVIRITHNPANEETKNSILIRTERIHNLVDTMFEVAFFPLLGFQKYWRRWFGHKYKAVRVLVSIIVFLSYLPFTIGLLVVSIFPIGYVSFLEAVFYDDEN